MANKNAMVANKADASKATKSNNKLKVYYYGATPEESGQAEVILDELDYKHRPWLIKFYTRDGVCHQYADTLGVYHRVSKDLSVVLDAVIVNAKQKAAVEKIINSKLLDYLGEDMSGERDGILDPCEY
jgi:hypothetical protein